MLAAIRVAVGVIVALVIVLPVLTKPMFSQTISELRGNIYFHKKNGATVQITSFGLDTDPSLSFDKRLVVFVRRTPSHTINTAIGPVDLNELWLAETSGKTEARRVLVGRDGADGVFAGFREPRFSLDAGRVYFTEEIGGPCHGIVMLDLKSGEVRNLIGGMGVEVVESGKFAGYLIVLKCISGRPWPEYNLQYWLLNDNGDEVKQLRGTEFDPKYFKRSAVPEFLIPVPGNFGTISGIVVDSTGAKVFNATVTFEIAGTTKAAKTSSNGRYTLALPAGRYQLRVEKPGFKSATVAATIEAGSNPDVAQVVLEFDPVYR
jgi:hypothetical protein